MRHPTGIDADGMRDSSQASAGGASQAGAGGGHALVRLMLGGSVRACPGRAEPSPTAISVPPDRPARILRVPRTTPGVARHRETGRAGPPGIPIDATEGADAAPPTRKTMR